MTNRANPLGDSEDEGGNDFGFSLRTYCAMPITVGLK